MYVIGRVIVEVPHTSYQICVHLTPEFEMSYDYCITEHTMALLKVNKPVPWKHDAAYRCENTG